MSYYLRGKLNSDFLVSILYDFPKEGINEIFRASFGWKICIKINQKKYERIMKQSN